MRERGLILETILRAFTCFLLRKARRKQTAIVCHDNNIFCSASSGTLLRSIFACYCVEKTLLLYLVQQLLFLTRVELSGGSHSSPKDSGKSLHRALHNLNVFERTIDTSKWVFLFQGCRAVKPDRNIQRSSLHTHSSTALAATHKSVAYGR